MKLPLNQVTQISLYCVVVMSVDLSILARGIPLDPLPELY